MCKDIVHLQEHAGRVIHGLHPTLADALHIDVVPRLCELRQAFRAVRKIGDGVIVWVASKRLEQNPEEVGEDPACAGTRVELYILEVVEHERDAAGEGKHDNEEGDQEHHHVLQVQV